MRRIHEAGHEVASHGWEHVRATEVDAESFREDVSRTRKLLEDTIGAPVEGFRAASFSIGSRNLWALDVLGEAGYLYSSSIYPIRHDLYGMPEAPRGPFRYHGTGILELPVTTVRLLGRNLPAGGGGYFRLLPYSYYRWALRQVNEVEGRPAIFYFHPWELDPGQPRQLGIGWKARVRHYTNLGRMEGRLARLLKEFRWCTMREVFADAVPVPWPDQGAVVQEATP